MDPGRHCAAGSAPGAAVLRQRMGAHRRFGPAVRDAGAGPEHRGGLRRPARPGVRGLLCRGRLHVRPAGLAAPGGQLRVVRRAIPHRVAHVAVDGDPAGPGAGGMHRRAAGHTGAQAARRLPGHRDAGLWRNHPHLHEQPGPPGQHHQRPQGPGADRFGEDLRVGPGQAAGAVRLRHQLRHAVLLPVPVLGAGHHFGVLSPAGFAHRARVDGHPRR